RIFCLASALASVPPPAPEPMITTTPSSSWAKVAMGYSSSCSCCYPVCTGCSEPVQIVEAAVYVAAVFPGRTLIAEQRKQRLVVVQAEHQAAAHGLEERRVFDLGQQGHTLGLVESFEWRAMGMARLLLQVFQA